MGKLQEKKYEINFEILLRMKDLFQCAQQLGKMLRLLGSVIPSESNMLKKF